MSRPRVTRGPIDDIAATVADLSARLRNLETVGHRHPTVPYLPENSPRVYRTTNQSIATGVTPTVLSWEAVDDTTWNAWVIGSPTLVTAPVTGRYWASAYVTWAANATGVRTVSILRTSDTATLAAVQDDTLGTAANTMRQVVTTPAFTLTAGDSVYVEVVQTSGGALNVRADIAGNLAPSFSLFLLA